MKISHFQTNKMEKITLFTLKTCPYCKQALAFMNTLFAEDPKYQALEIENIDEQERPDISEKYDYYLVPTFYIGEKKMHEGAATLDKVRGVFDAALVD